MTLQEINERRAELRSLLETDDCNLDEIETEINSLNEQEAQLREQATEVVETTTDDVAEVLEVETEKAQRNREIANAINTSDVIATEKKEEKIMEERFTISSPEYRTAWAKSLMGVQLNEVEKRALGDAVTTTATTFVQATEDANGINNGGLFIPTSIREELMQIIEKQSPFFADCRKLQVRGNVDLPFIYAADDANWYVEANQTANEGIEFKRIQLTGWELAKDIVITWKVEAMAVESFIRYLLEELASKMGKAIANACLYGTGSNQPTGATHGLTPVTSGTSMIDKIKATKAELSDDAKVGAVCYISPAAADEITFYKDGDNNYPYLAGLPRIANLELKVEPFLKDKDVLIGNPMNYVFNFNEDIRVDKELTVKGRKVTYGGYCVADGNAKPDSFAYHHVSASV